MSKQASAKSKINSMPCVMSYPRMAKVLRAAVEVGWRMRRDVEVAVREGAIEAPADAANDLAPRFEVNELIDMVMREAERA